MKKHIEVVAAVINEGGKFFAAQRADRGELAKKWEFPGGKIELGETKEEALKRELKEELDILVEINKFLVTVKHEYNTFNITLHAYECTIKSGDIKLKEHLNSKWLSKEELYDVDWAEADLPIIKSIEGE